MENIVLFETRIARRGKGAKGSVEVKTFGKPDVDETGIARDFEYGKELIDSYSINDLMDYAQSKGHDIVELLMRALDSKEKALAMKSQNARSLLLVQIMAEFKCEEKEGKNLVNTVLNLQTATNKTIDESIEILKLARVK